MSLRQFAEHLGVSDRMVSKWEARGERIQPRPVNQAALDTSLTRASTDEQERFQRLRRGTASGPQTSRPRDASGPAGKKVRHPVDGKLMVLVEAGDFHSGPDNESVWLPSYYVDVYPTTNADYARFIAATDHPAPTHWPDGHCPAELLEHPVVFVTWHDAAAYATWSRKSLPSSRQWEKAARGPNGHAFPWGDSNTPAKCNVREGRLRNTTPVDRYHSGTSPYGVYDLCGNVWEWCSTETDPGRYELKGSSFTSPFNRAAPSAFNDASADMLDDDTGYRCAVSGDGMDQLQQDRR